MRHFTILIVVLVLAACSGGPTTKAPSYVDNACSIKKKQRTWFRDLNRAKRKWGVQPAIVLSMIYHESKFLANARTPLQYKMGVIPWGRKSSAYGYAQAIDSTWDWYKRDTGNRRAKRNDFGDSVDFIGWYMTETVKRNGVSKSDAFRQYLAYHQGHGGFARGSYRSQSWLINYARRVENRAVLYQAQLNSCRG